MNPIDASWIERVAKKVVPKVLKFYRVDPEFKVEIEIGQRENRSADIVALPQYLTASIVFDPSGAVGGKDGWYSAIVHEACHIVTARLSAELDAVISLLPEGQRDYAAAVLERQHEELTERLARVYIGLHPLKEVQI